MPIPVACRALVLDEVDKLFDGGFARELNNVVGMLPETKRQNLFFSATFKQSQAGRNNTMMGQSISSYPLSERMR